MKSKAYFYSLDLVRFIAAFWVMGYHYFRSIIGWEHVANVFQVFRYGFLGVPVFFIISGFVIAQSINKESPLRFILLRLLRVYPVYWISFFIMCVAYILLYVKFPYSFVTYIDFIVQLSQQLSLLKTGELPWLGTAWTLRYELIFYSMAFAISLLFTLVRRNIFLKIVSFICLAVIIKYFYLQLFPYFYLFMAGVMLYALTKLSSILQKLLFLVILTVFSYYLLIPATNIYYLNPISQGFNGALLNSVLYGDITIILFMIFMIFMIFNKSIDNKFNNYWIKLLGAISYPVYVLHEQIGILVISRITSKLPFPYIVILCFMALVVVFAGIINVLDKKIQLRGREAIDGWGRTNV